MTITKEQFGLWKHEPATKWFFEFLKAKQEFMKSAALDQWLSNAAWPETVRGQIIELGETIDLQHEVIVHFYEEMNESESEGNS